MKHFVKVIIAVILCGMTASAATMSVRIKRDKSTSSTSVRPSVPDHIFFNCCIDGTTLSIFSDQYDRLLTLTISDESGNPIISEILNLTTGEDSTEVPTAPGNYTITIITDVGNQYIGEYTL